MGNSLLPELTAKQPMNLPDRAGFVAKELALFAPPHPAPNREAKTFTLLDLDIPLLRAPLLPHLGLILFILGLLVNISWIFICMKYKTQALQVADLLR